MLNILEGFDLRSMGLGSVEYLHNLITLSRGMNKQVAANYVEDARVADQLSRWGGNLLQGYWIGKPRPLEELIGQAASSPVLN